MANVTMATLTASEMRLGSIHMGGTAGPGILPDRRRRVNQNILVQGTDADKL